MQIKQLEYGQLMNKANVYKFFKVFIYNKKFEGHTDEIFSCAFNYEADTIITGNEKIIIMHLKRFKR